MRSAAPIRPEEIRAVVLDVDGTLYRQGPVRRGMMLKLAAAHAFQPRRGLAAARILSAYRRAQERIRVDAPAAPRDLAVAQIEMACSAAAATPDAARECVARWMEQEPLVLVRRHARPGLRPFLERCRAAGIRLGVFSDYPAAQKLAALGIEDLIEVNACAQDSAVGLFKPHPRGIEFTLEQLGVAPADALYVGDRPEVDAEAAAAAGSRCAIMTSWPGESAASGFFTFRSFAELEEWLFGGSREGRQAV